MMKLSAEEKFALEQARKNGYLVVEKCRGDWETWPYRRVWEIWVKECLTEGKPLIWVVCDGQIALVMFDIEAVPHQISPEGVNLLAQVVQPYPNAGYPWTYCKVPETEMHGVARQMVRIAQQYGRSYRGYRSDITSLLYGRESKDMRPFFSWLETDTCQETVPHHEYGFRERRFWETFHDANHQSIEEMAQRGYVIARCDTEQWNTWRYICTERSLPFVGVSVIAEMRAELVLLLHNERTRLNLDGIQQAYEVCSRCADSCTTIMASSKGVLCSSIPTEYVADAAPELFRIGQTYVYAVPANPEGDPE